MPIYEYKCLDCGVHVEKMQKFSDEPLTSLRKLRRQDGKTNVAFGLSI